MSDFTFWEKFWLIVMAIFALVGLFIAGSNFASNTLMDDAVAKGHAEYYLDANHDKRWRWKEAK